MDIFDAIAKRRSVRKYKGGAIPRATLEKLIQAGAMAPSGCNQQGWVFVAVDDPAIREQIAKMAGNGRFIAQAGACIAIFCDRQSLCIVEDCSAATENIMLAATAEGLGTCWVNSHGLGHAAGVEKLLGCPPTHELVVLMAVGVPDGKTPAPQKKALSEVLRWNQF
jgi:nitroreductase